MSATPDQVAAVVWGAWVVSWMAAAAWSSPAERRPPVRSESLYRLVTIAGAVLLFGLQARWRWPDVPLWHAGREVAWTLVLVTLGGFTFTWWARITLGRLWSSGVTRKADHRIITAGPYHIVRHPIYSGLLLSVVATAAMRGTAAGCLGAALIALGLWIKAGVEERFLRRELGEDRYDAYAHRVPMLVPFLR
jgi:protein-S-isoprenylcysteine O-methyltransferase Ste14